MVWGSPGSVHASTFKTRPIGMEERKGAPEGSVGSVLGGADVMTWLTASTMLRQCLLSSLRSRGGVAAGPSRWSSPDHQERPHDYLFNRTPPPTGQSRKWEDWELPYYLANFLTIVILGVGLNAKPDLTIETWSHNKALKRLQMEEK